MPTRLWTKRHYPTQARLLNFSSGAQAVGDPAAFVGIKFPDMLRVIRHDALPGGVVWGADVGDDFFNVAFFDPVVRDVYHAETQAVTL